MNVNICKLDISVLRLKADDILIIGVHGPLTEGEAAHIRKSFEQLMPERVKLIVTNADHIELCVIRPSNTLEPSWTEMAKLYEIKPD